MPESSYAREVEIVQRAIAALRTERDPGLVGQLEKEQMAAGTRLEWYGITKSVFERLLSSHQLSDETRAALRDGVNAVRVNYGGEKA